MSMKIIEIQEEQQRKREISVINTKGIDSSCRESISLVWILQVGCMRKIITRETFIKE